MSDSNEELEAHILERFDIQQLLGKGVCVLLYPSDMRKSYRLKGLWYCVEMRR